MASRLLNAVERQRLDLNPMTRARITYLSGLVLEANSLEFMYEWGMVILK